MDRFIELSEQCIMHLITYLKSNMDRFIEDPDTKPNKPSIHLKSNMDRFIVTLVSDI